MSEARKVTAKDCGAIVPGAIFVEENPFLPATLRLESGDMRGGWARVANAMDGGQLEKTLTAAGWTSFFIAGAIETTVFGFNQGKMVETAWKRLITNLQIDRCNCVEIDAVTASRCFGMPYVRLSAHARQIQEEKTLRIAK